MNNYTFLTLAAEDAGGLFDFGPTLPLIVIQFLALLFILNIILYNPLITLLEKRASNIVNQLTAASQILATGNELVELYSQTIEIAQTQGRNNWTLAKQEQNKLYEDIFLKARAELSDVTAEVFEEIDYAQLETFKYVVQPATIKMLSLDLMNILFKKVPLPYVSKST